MLSGVGDKLSRGVVLSQSTFHLVFKFVCWFRFIFRVYLGLPFMSFFSVSLDRFIHVLLAFVVLGLVSSIPSRLRLAGKNVPK